MLFDSQEHMRVYEMTSVRPAKIYTVILDSVTLADL